MTLNHGNTYQNARYNTNTTQNNKNHNAQHNQTHSTTQATQAQHNTTQWKMNQMNVTGGQPPGVSATSSISKTQKSTTATKHSAVRSRVEKGAGTWMI